MQKLFEKNIKFFYENIPNYYNLIKNIKKRNYIIKNDNIYDLKTNTPLYPDSVSYDSEKIASNPLTNSLWEKNFFSLEPIIWDESQFPHTGKAINDLVKRAKKLPSYNNNGVYTDKNFLPATLLSGLLSGKHLDLLVKNYDFHSLFVYEPNPEFFAISLYFVDYEFIYKKLKERFFLWVNAPIDYFAIEKFFYERIVTSSFLTISYSIYEHPLIADAKKKFNEIRLSKYRGWGTFEDEIQGLKNHRLNINKYPVLLKKEKLNVPICVVANGKSLEKNIKFIKKNLNSMIVVSVGTSITPLLQEGIHSDFHIEQERIELLKEILKKPLKKYKGRFIGANVVNPQVFTYSDNPLMYIREGFAYNKSALKGSSPLVGNAGVAFAAMFSEEIYLCGMDLGFRPNEKKHSKNSFYDDKDDIATNGIEIKGNFSNDIHTDSLYLSSKRNIESLIKALNIKVYNLSDGAYIQHTIPLKDKKLPLIDKQFYINEIIKCFEYSEINDYEFKIHDTLSLVERSLKRNISNIKELTGTIDFLEDVFKSNNPQLNILKGSIKHILFNIYFLAHKLSARDFERLISNLSIKNFFPSKI